MLQSLKNLFAKPPVPWAAACNQPDRITPVEDLIGPPLSIVIICYKMDRQIANTILSLLPPYQQNIDEAQYEIHVIDNGSPEPLDEKFWKQSPIVHYHYVPKDQATGNPGTALNRGVQLTRSKHLCLMIDGARMLTSGAVRWGLDLLQASPRAVVDVRSFHLGDKLQMDAIAEGYDSEKEQELLNSIGWPGDGYRLFDIGVPSLPTRSVFLGGVFECNCLFISRGLFDEIAGYDERYADPGGGLVGVDFFHRVVAAADPIFTMLGEGTFHQTHGGAASGLTREKHAEKIQRWREEYARLSRPWSDRHSYPAVVAGHVPPTVARWLKRVERSR